jgi:hypothetical protein
MSVSDIEKIVIRVSYVLKFKFHIRNTQLDLVQVTVYTCILVLYAIYKLTNQLICCK